MWQRTCTLGNAFPLRQFTVWVGTSQEHFPSFPTVPTWVWDEVLKTACEFSHFSTFLSSILQAITAPKVGESKTRAWIFWVHLEESLVRNKPHLSFEHPPHSREDGKNSQVAGPWRNEGNHNLKDVDRSLSKTESQIRKIGHNSQVF